MEGKLIKIGPAEDRDLKITRIVDWDEGSPNGIISQIFISHSSIGLVSIQFQFVIDDKYILSDLHGRNSGSMFDVISLNWPHEYITGISGTQSSNSFNRLIMSLKFTTNTNSYGPFGSDSSSSIEKFDFKLGKYSQCGGFYGKCDDSGLRHIGVYLQPTTVK